jgi:hypothetical protein
MPAIIESVCSRVENTDANDCSTLAYAWIAAALASINAMRDGLSRFGSSSGMILSSGDGLSSVMISPGSVTLLPLRRGAIMPGGIECDQNYEKQQSVTDDASNNTSPSFVHASNPCTHWLLPLRQELTLLHRRPWDVSVNNAHAMDEPMGISFRFRGIVIESAERSHGRPPVPFPFNRNRRSPEHGVTKLEGSRPNGKDFIGGLFAHRSVDPWTRPSMMSWP